DKIPRCHAEDTSCVVKVANFFVREFKNGDKQLDIPQLDPYIYNSPILISPSAGGSFSLNMEGRNNKLSGLSTETFKKAVGFTKDIKTSKFELYGNVPKLILEGDYKATGKFLGSDINGDGKYKIEIEDVTGNIKFKPSITKLKMEKHL
uniref:Uncharacterized protein n=1 Tax=Megaselia scalaris TaxID=36166 RepID=T1H1F9_MEGSC